MSDVTSLDRKPKVDAPLPPLTAGGGELVKENRRVRKVLARNAMANITRLGVSGVVSLLLPAFFIRHLPHQAYNAWVLVLQLGSYAGVLDFGMQIAVSKYVAEFDAQNDTVSSNRLVSTALLLLSIAGLAGIGLTIVLSLFVHRMFPEIPPELERQVRYGLLLYGTALSLALPASTYAGIFLGLQRNSIPVSLQILNKVLGGLLMAAAVLLHEGIVLMAGIVGLLNLMLSWTQAIFVRRFVPSCYLSWRLITRSDLKRLVHYCSALGLWSVTMLLVSGLDTTIVAHYDFSSTAYYAVAATATGMVATLLSAAIAPLIPAASALSAQRTPKQMGELLVRVTRLSVLLIIATGAPLLLYGYGALCLWMGQSFAVSSVPILHVLVLANMVRLIGLPYSAMVVGTGKQWLASLAPVCEAAVNFIASIVLARHIGAIGVAYGTFIGSFVSIAIIFTVCLRATRNTLNADLRTITGSGLLKPGVAVIPILVVLPYWWTNHAPELSRTMYGLVDLLTVVLLLIGLDINKRRIHEFRSFIMKRPASLGAS